MALSPGSHARRGVKSAFKIAAGLGHALRLVALEEGQHRVGVRHLEGIITSPIGVTPVLLLR
jgi:hypothetical protein